MKGDTLKKQALTGVIWSFINRFGIQILSIAPAMILARLLSPEEYGLVAIAAIFSGVAYILSDGGFGSALIQKKDADTLDYNSVFYCNLAINSIIYALSYYLAPVFSNYFGYEQVTSIIRISMLGLPIMALGQVQTAIFRIELDFKKPAIRNMVTQVISAIVAIIMAFAGCGVWALVIQSLLQTVLNAIINWYICWWKPAFQFSFCRLKTLASFGINLYFKNIIEYGFNKSYDFTVAKLYSATNLSYYNRAYTTINIFVNSITGVLNSVAFPTFAKMQEDKQNLKNNFRKFISIVFMCSTMLMGLCLILSEPLFHFMYSSKWDATLPYFRIVCIWGIVVPIKIMLDNVLTAIGCSGALLFNSISNKIFIICSLCIAYHFGIIFMLWGQIITMIIEIIILSHFSNKKISYSIKEIISDIIPYIIPTIIIVSLVALFDYNINAVAQNFFASELIISFIRLSTGFIIGGILFIALYRILDINGYRVLINLITDNAALKKYKKWLIAEK
ncbi:MAG: lipopolysaccharide biosynthesis protein [Bacteroidaceae bacterium]|nr:lipopolysaccharide biosynthesis protein [Bacteroidaceae bacterium]